MRPTIGAVLLGAILGTAVVSRMLVVVRGPSMEPALWEGDRLITLPALRRRLGPGMLVVVTDPTTPGHLVVKRLRSVSEGRIEVRGDAADRSADSRHFGPLPLSAVRRIVVARWPDLRTPLRREIP